MGENKREIQKRLTRKRIIDSAINEYGENGITKTTTSHIAKAANVSHGTIFVHFKTEEELLEAVIEKFGNDISERLHELIDDSSSLQEVLKAHLKGIGEYEKFYTRYIGERMLLPESVRSIYVMIESTISFHIGLAAEKEMKEGKIKKVPLYFLFNTWVGLIHYYLNNKDLFSKEHNIIEKYGDELIENFIKLIET